MAEKLSLTLVLPAVPAGGELHSLEALLGRADFERGADQGLEALLFGLFGGSASGDADLPVAAVTRVAECNGDSAGWWLRVDPVYLTPDRQYLVMLGNERLNVSAGEARALTAELGELFAERGGRLDAPHPKRWYLHLPTPPRLRTTPLPDVLGRHIDAHLPWGDDGRQWHVLLNELQMQLHISPVNRAREGRGELPVNSVWFWGGGEAPVVEPALWQVVYTDEPFAKGLAELAGIAHRPIPEGLDPLLASGIRGQQLVVFDSVAGEAVERLERDWFKPLYQALKRRTLGRVTLYLGDGQRYVATPASMLRIWRRRKKLT